MWTDEPNELQAIMLIQKGVSNLTPEEVEYLYQYSVWSVAIETAPPREEFH